MTRSATSCSPRVFPVMASCTLRLPAVRSRSRSCTAPFAHWTSRPWATAASAAENPLSKASSIDPGICPSGKAGFQLEGVMSRVWQGCSLQRLHPMPIQTEVLIQRGFLTIFVNRKRDGRVLQVAMGLKRNRTGKALEVGFGQLGGVHLGID